MKPADCLNLEHEGWRLQVSLLGGCILSCTYEGQDILRPAQDDWIANPDPVLTSCFPLVPFSNRIANGQFSFDGQDIELPLTRRDEPHPIHGYGWMSEWEVKTQTQNTLVLKFDYTGAEWPWPFSCEQSFTVKDNTLTVSLGLQNTGKSAMPAGMGFHPYFPDASMASLKFGTDGYWKGDVENLPTKWKSETFVKARPVSELAFDNCFTGWDKHAEVTWPNQPHKVEIQGSDLFDFAVLYTPKNEDYFCFEPTSHMNNAVNFEGGSVDTGLQVLPPGNIMNGSMTLRTVSK